MKEVLSAILFYVYIVTALFVFFRNIRDTKFLLKTALYFTVYTVPLCLVIYGSAYAFWLDYSHWQFNSDMALLPFKLTNSGKVIQNAELIEKSGSYFWAVNFLFTSFYITFPQVVIKAASQCLVKSNIYWLCLRAISACYGVGIGFITFIITLTSITAPFPSENWFVMLVSFIFIASTMGSYIVVDVKDGFARFVSSS